MSNVNTRSSAAAAQVKVTAVASCSHMLILQRGPHTHTTHNNTRTKSSGRPLISVAHCHGGAISHMLPANLPPCRPSSQTWLERRHEHMNGFSPERQKRRLGVQILFSTDVGSNQSQYLTHCCRLLPVDVLCIILKTFRHIWFPRKVNFR